MSASSPACRPKKLKSGGGGETSVGTSVVKRERKKLDVWPGENAADEEPLRNVEPDQITTHGFVECESLLPANLCVDLNNVPMERAEGISNAFQKDIKGSLRDHAVHAIGGSKQVSDAVHAVFGTHQFDVMNVKILMNEIGSNPQIPHADDHCNRELFGVAHIQDEQPATEGIPYDAQAPYPTGLQVECEGKKWRALPDVGAPPRARRGRALHARRRARAATPTTMSARSTCSPTIWRHRSTSRSSTRRRRSRRCALPAARRRRRATG